MSGISTGVGIFSGIDTRSLIDQLIQIEARPKQLAQRRLLQLQSQQAALLDINTALLGLKNAAGAFDSQNIFGSTRATSSQPNVLTATAGTNAGLGAFNLTVSRLVSTHQEISRGFADADSAGLGADSFTFEVGGRRLDNSTLLSELNGGDGVQRGKIRITDSTGASAEIDLSGAVTVNDILNAINSNGSISVNASVDGQGLSVADTAGGASNLQIENLFGSETATSLGLAGSVAAGGTLSSGNIRYISDSTPLSALNDGNGVSFRPGGQSAAADFHIVVDDGSPTPPTYLIHLGEIGTGTGEDYEVTGVAVVTVGDLIERINTEVADQGGDVTASISPDGLGITLTTANTADTLLVENSVSGSQAYSTAADLGLLDQASVIGAEQTVTGRRLLAGINSTLARNLNGGAGVEAGTIQFDTRSGLSFTVDVSEEDSVDDIIDAVNAAAQAAGANLTASINDAGNGLRIVDATTGGNDLVIADTVGTAAAGLAIATAGEADGVVESGNLQTQWITRATRLSSLNFGKGVGTGSFAIRGSNGVEATIQVGANILTIGQLVEQINARTDSTGVSARINDSGDGLILEDTLGGAAPVTVTDVSGTIARRLNLAGEAEDPDTDNSINGSFEKTVEFEAGDTLREVAQKINAAGVGVDATVINDGAGVSPFRLILTSEQSGRAGRAIIDTRGFDLGLNTLSQGRDAIVFFGSGESTAPLLLTSSTNTLDSVISGVTIDLLATSATPVEVAVSRDTAAIETAMQSFVEAFNNVVDRMQFHERFDEDTNQKGALLGEPTIANVRSTLYRAVQSPAENVESSFEYFFDVGVTFSDGGKIEFDRERFRTAYEQDPEGVEQVVAGFAQTAAEPEVLEEDENGNPLVTTPGEAIVTSRGVAEVMETLMEALTDSVDGLVTRRRNVYDTQIRLQQSRIADFDVQLNLKRQKLERDFLAMERALASLQTQQSALGSISSILG